MRRFPSHPTELSFFVHRLIKTRWNSLSSSLEKSPKAIYTVERIVPLQRQKRSFSSLNPRLSTVFGTMLRSGYYFFAVRAARFRPASRNHPNGCHYIDPINYGKELGTPARNALRMKYCSVISRASDPASRKSICTRNDD